MHGIYSESRANSIPHWPKRNHQHLWPRESCPF